MTLNQQIKRWAAELGFQACGIAGIEPPEAEARFLDWLRRGYHGDMDYMARHGTKRSRPAELEPGTLRVISVRMDYLPPDLPDAWAQLADPLRATVSRYALGRDYHKLMRQRLQRLAERIESRVGAFHYRAFSDSAPVLEKPLANQAGLGWQGKHSNLIAQDAGSWFFLGELYVGLELPIDPPADNHCGSCQACIDVCPTQAIVAPYQVDARRCISYLTIELHGPIPEALRAPIGNRIYGCDDCQLVCPWNKFATPTAEVDFHPRNGLDQASLIALFAWDESTFLARTEGSAIRRIGHERWLRNIAVALGNAYRANPLNAHLREALVARCTHPSPLIREHVVWAMNQVGKSADYTPNP
ncbi:MAG: tRNA epoxyqueuosine(34) reductase QueG [Gammaproteobacteria bacterium]|nr:tRNA epoxyqueuosine(34) reductase QueG [Gammaproteobacteria bacterium]